MAKKTITAKAEAIGVPAKKAPAAKKPIPLLTAGVLGDKLASTFEIPKSHGKAFVDEVFSQMGATLKKGGKVQIAHLGVFQVKKRASRNGRNPSTGESLKIKASKRVAFTTARDLKEQL
jgi:DNA-binding protein HU-beta